LYFDCQGKDDNIPTPIVVQADFARQLERELDQSQRFLKSSERARQSLSDACDSLQREIRILKSNAAELERRIASSQAREEMLLKQRDEMTEQRDAAMATLRLEKENHEREIAVMTEQRDSARGALILAARWGISSDGYSAEVASRIRCWIISGMIGNAPTAPDYYPQPTETK
jgi:predicted RNase H-like nuclease (RuvC/YqgF family)